MIICDHIIYNMYTKPCKKPTRNYKESYIWTIRPSTSQNFTPDILQYCKSEVVVFLILLVWWLDVPKKEDQPYQSLEFFSGVGRIAAFSKLCGYESAAVDLDYGKEFSERTNKRSPMDMNSDAGLVLLVWIIFRSFWIFMFLLVPYLLYNTHGIGFFGVAASSQYALDWSGPCWTETLHPLGAMWWIWSSLWIFCSGLQQLGTGQCREFYENHLNSTWLWAFCTSSESKQNDLEETLFLFNSVLCVCCLNLFASIYLLWIRCTISGFKCSKHVCNHAWTDKKKSLVTLQYHDIVSLGYNSKLLKSFNGFWTTSWNHDH